MDERCRPPHTAGTSGDEPNGLVNRMSEALACRYTGKAPSESARDFMGGRIADLARVCLQAKGIRAPMTAGKTIELAMHPTSDFPSLLEGAPAGACSWIPIRRPNPPSNACAGEVPLRTSGRKVRCDWAKRRGC